VKNRRQVPILIADDDTEDVDMIREALKESRLLNDIIFVADGEQLMDYLRTVRKQ
jgi:CheY-like chemotaxis protein